MAEAEDLEAEVAELRDRIERQVDEYVAMVKQLDALSRKVTRKRFVPAVHHDA
jgi:hypothetical protein